jgi:hypothetical protein
MNNVTYEDHHALFSGLSYILPHISNKHGNYIEVHFETKTKKIILFR